MNNTLRSIGLWTESVDDSLLLSMLHRIWERKSVNKVQVNPYESLSEQILPGDFSLYEDDDLVLLNDNQAFINLDAEDRPKDWRFEFMDLFLGSEAKKGEFIKSDYLIHIGIQILNNQSVARASAMAKREAIEKNISAGMGKWFPDLLLEGDDMQGAVSALQSGDRVIHIHTNVIFKGDKDKISLAASNYASMMRKKKWGFVPSKSDHLATMLAAMPMSLVEEHKTALGKKSICGIGYALAELGRGKKTVSSETKALLPVIGEYKGNLNAPGMLLTGRRGQIKYFSQFGSELVKGMTNNSENVLENYNCIIAGMAGSGKSVLMQEMMLSVLGVGGRVFVLDYGKSFKNLCQVLSGNYIEFDPSNAISINPFSEVPTGSDKASSDARSDFLASFPITLATMAAPKSGTTDLQQTNLAKALKACWDKKQNNTEIDDIADWLLEQKDNQVANDLGRMLFNYTTDGPYGGFFTGKAEVTIDADIVVIETDHLRNYPDLMAVVTQIMITHIK